MKYPLSPDVSRRDYARELNAEQYAAVTTSARHVLVIAGAGSGKTRTLTYRVARLLEEGTPPWRILLLTFTNKAAREMLTRVSELTGTDATQLWGGTFHAVANRLLRRHAARLGYQPGFSILDSDDQKALMRALIRPYSGKSSGKTGGSFSGRNERFPKPEQLLSLHSLAVNTARPWEEVLDSHYPHLKNHAEALSAIYQAYRERKRETNSMDFDDLLLQLLRLLKEHEDIRQELQERFLHVLVDEYQDTNAPQEEIISLLAGGERTSLMAVGDDAQSIYSWRGANVDHLFDFSHTYPDAQIYKIETNYRSVPSILAVSNAAIAQNARQFTKVLKPAREEGKLKPAVIPAPDNRTEAQFVARRIDELLAGGIAGKDIAVLYRAHFHSLDVQMELTRQHIPFRITSGLRFFEQAHVKDVLAPLRLLVNPEDEVAFRRIVSTFPRVGEATAGKLYASWKNTLRTWQQQHPDTVPPGGSPGTQSSASPGTPDNTPLFPPLAPFRNTPHSLLLEGMSVPPALRAHWEPFLTLMDSLHPADTTLTTLELINRVRLYLDPYWRTAYENYEERMEDLEQLARTVADSPDLHDFLSQAALLSETDQETAPEDDCITLSTIHQAKGLEWKAVFIIFLAEGMFPHYRVIESGDLREMEEETRLFYVAVTRAEDQLYLSWPRYNGHSYDRQFCPPSRFLTHLPSDLLELWEV